MRGHSKHLEPLLKFITSSFLSLMTTAGMSRKGDIGTPLRLPSWRNVHCVKSHEGHRGVNWDKPSHVEQERDNILFKSRIPHVLVLSNDETEWLHSCIVHNPLVAAGDEKIFFENGCGRGKNQSARGNLTVRRRSATASRHSSTAISLAISN